MLRNQKFTDCYRRSIASGDQGFRHCGNAVMIEENLTIVKKKRPAHNAGAGKGQVNKSIRRMPWHWEPKKDVISCEKLR